MSEGDKQQWFVLGMRYIKALTVAADLQPAGMECFVPPVVTNMLFVHSTKDRIDDYLNHDAMGQRLYYLRNRPDLQPIVVRDKDMESFMLVCKAMQAPIIMTECPKVKLGDKVRVIDGGMKGVEGNVVRIQKQKRVLINVGNILWAATVYLKPEQLEVIDK